jgi:two-component system LytT family sensor kinase
MHPFLKSLSSLFITILLWIPIIICVIILTHIMTEVNLSNSALLIFPAMMIELFILISNWYICKALPIRRSNIFDIIIRHSFTSFLINSIWLFIIFLYSVLLDFIFNTHLWNTYYKAVFPILVASGLFFYFLASLFHYLVLALEKTKNMEQKILANHLTSSQAELKSLKSTIHPHFLFNSLTALGTLTQTSPSLAQKVCIQLSDFLRYSLKYSTNDKVTITDELQHIENYLNVEKIRFGERLKIELSVEEETKHLLILPFILLPLVENAIKHGVQERIETTVLHISINKNSHYLNIAVTNPYDLPANPPGGTGHGLSNLRKRITSEYGNDARLVIEKKRYIFTVRLQIPIEKNELL